MEVLGGLVFKLWVVERLECAAPLQLLSSVLSVLLHTYHAIWGFSSDVVVSIAKESSLIHQLLLAEHLRHRTFFFE